MKKAALVIGLAAFWFVIPQLGLSLSYLHIFQMMWIWILATVSIRLLFTTGQLTLAHGAFMSIGGYTSAILTVTYGWPVIPAVIVGMLISAAVAAPFGWLCLRVKGGYFVLFTLAFTHLLEQVFLGWTSLTNGPKGISSVPKPSFFPSGAEGRVVYYYMTVVVAMICLIIMWRLERSRIGLSWWSIRLRDNLAQSVGIQIARYKVINFVIGSVIASLCGSLYVHYLSVINPHSFGTLISVHLSVYAIVGGINSIWGSILGGGIFTALPPILQTAFNMQIIDKLRPIIVGCSMIAVMIFLPDGLISLPKKFRKWRRKKKGVAEVATS